MYFPQAEKLRIDKHLHGKDSVIRKSFTVQITVLKGYHLLYNDKDAIPKLKIKGNHDLVMIKMFKS